jgi:sterol desaturase/sphingolipid hydroxylase (fatty acid hydroxylase superfamily)
MTMSVTSNLAPPTGPGALRRSATRLRRLRPARKPAESLPTTPLRPSRAGLVVLGAVTVALALLACAFVATGVVVLVDNGVAEWLAAAVPAVLAGLLFFLAAKFGGALLDGTGDDRTHRH